MKKKNKTRNKWEEEFIDAFDGVIKKYEAHVTPHAMIGLIRAYEFGRMRKISELFEKNKVKK